MTLTIKTRDQFVQDEVSAIQAASPNTFNFPVGSSVRAIVDAHSGTAMWLQGNVQLIYNRERLATSTGTDVDSFLADFNLKRQGAIPAAGNVGFSSFTATTQRTILVGAQVSTPGSTATPSVFFQVVADSNNTYYNATVGGYVIPPGIGTVGVPVQIPVQAVVPGAAGNVQANTITVINSPITGIDTVSNSLAFTDGADAQSDSAAKAYFVSYFNSLSRATPGAIDFAVQSVNDVTEYIKVENKNYDTGADQLGYFYVVVDNGTGTPPDALVTSVINAVSQYRGLTIRFDVKKPIVVNVTVNGNIVLPAGYSNPNLIPTVTTALTKYINAIPIGGTLFYFRIFQVIYDAIATLVSDPNLLDQFAITGLTVNGGTSDITSNTKQSIYPSPGGIVITTS